ncbi:MAG: 50S ribosomal protein L11 methyltransferase [Pseudomonadota bacterium]
MGWQQVTMPVGTFQSEALENALLEAGAAAISYTDAADQPILEPLPGEAPLWHDARLSALFADDLPYEQISLALVAKLGVLPEGIEVELLADRAWEREWLRHFQPTDFGHGLWVAPTDAEVAAGPNATVLRLDPGLAFGTGTHATTALCLQRIAALDLTGETLLDYGCGSGILAVAGLLRGASHAVCQDIDPQALTATKANAEVNGVSDRITVSLPPEASALLPEPVPVVVANILAGPLIALAPRIAQALQPGGRLLLSGILDAQADTVRAAYQSWIEFVPIARQDGWVMLEGLRRNGV